MTNTQADRIKELLGNIASISTRTKYWFDEVDDTQESIRDIKSQINQILAVYDEIEEDNEQLS